MNILRSSTPPAPLGGTDRVDPPGLRGRSRSTATPWRSSASTSPRLPGSSRFPFACTPSGSGPGRRHRCSRSTSSRGSASMRGDYDCRVVANGICAVRAMRSGGCWPAAGSCTSSMPAALLDPSHRRTFPVRRRRRWSPGWRQGARPGRRGGGLFTLRRGSAGRSRRSGPGPATMGRSFRTASEPPGRCRPAERGVPRAVPGASQPAAAPVSRPRPSQEGARPPDSRFRGPNADRGRDAAPRGGRGRRSAYVASQAALGTVARDRRRIDLDRNADGGPQSTKPSGHDRRRSSSLL